VVLRVERRAFAIFFPPAPLFGPRQLAPGKDAASAPFPSYHNLLAWHTRTQAQRQRRLGYTSTACLVERLLSPEEIPCVGFGSLPVQHTIMPFLSTRSNGGKVGKNYSLSTNRRSPLAPSLLICCFLRCVSIPRHLPVATAAVRFRILHT
jgi:hypothetical protein